MRLADGRVLDRFILLDHRHESRGEGEWYSLRGIADGRLEKQVQLQFRHAYPGLVLMTVGYRNVGKQPLAISRWWSASHTLLPHPQGAWTFSGSSHPDRRDWVQRVSRDFQQQNFMGMNGSDYGSGTPVSVVWRPDLGLAVGHVERVPKLVALPVAAQPDGTQIAIEGDEPILLEPGQSVTLPETLLMVHSGDHFGPLDTYRRIMAERGLSAPNVPELSYAPIWCAWGYERNFTPEQVYGTLDKAKAVGCEWAVLDDGWQKGVGDWVADTAKFRDGNAGMKAFASRIKSFGHAPQALDFAVVSRAGNRPDARTSRHAVARRRRRGPKRDVVEQLYAVPGVSADHRLFQGRHPADHRRLGLRGPQDRRAGPQRRRALLQPRAQPCPARGVGREAAGLLEGHLRHGNRDQSGHQHRDLSVRHLLRLLQYSGDEQHPGIRP